MHRAPPRHGNPLHEHAPEMAQTAQVACFKTFHVAAPSTRASATSSHRRSSTCACRRQLLKSILCLWMWMRLVVDTWLGYVLFRRPEATGPPASAATSYGRREEQVASQFPTSRSLAGRSRLRAGVSASLHAAHRPGGGRPDGGGGHRRAPRLAVRAFDPKPLGSREFGSPTSRASGRRARRRAGPTSGHPAALVNEIKARVAALSP